MSRKRMSCTTAILGSAVAMFGLVAGAGRATASEPDAPAEAERTPIAISIGDSFISGEGGRFAGNIYSSKASDGARDDGPHEKGWQVYRDQTGEEPLTYGPKRCHRSNSAEIDVAARANGWTPINLACSGAVTKDILKGGFRDEKAQLKQLEDYASDPSNDVKAVVVSIGGNDLGFSDLLTDATQYKLYHDAREEGIFDKYLARGNEVQARITETLDQITNVMRQNGYADGSYKFVYQSYSNLFAPSNNRYKTDSWFDSWYQESPGVPLSNATVDHSRNLLVPTVTNLNRSAWAQAANQQIQFMDLTNAFAGHELSSKDTRLLVDTNEAPQAASAEWVVPINANYVAGSLFDTERQQESYHPNRFGQEAYGTCLTKTLQSDAKVTTCVGQPGKTPTEVVVTPGS